MQIDNTYVYYLTGQGTTERYATALAGRLPGEVKTTRIRADIKPKLEYGPNDLLVIGAPVIGGFIPPLVWEVLEGAKGDNTPAVIMCTYGACGFDKGPSEMKVRLTEMGFVPIAAACMIARHSLIDGIAEGRPNDQDIEDMRAFGDRVANLLADMNSIEDAPVLNLPDTPDRGTRMGVVPYADASCMFCGNCAEQCPADAIPHGSPSSTVAEKCISCMRCVSACPVHARKIDAGLAAQLADVLPKVAAYAASQGLAKNWVF